MFSIKSKGHSDGGRCARNPNRGHKPTKGSARIAAKCLSSCHYAAVAVVVARELPMCSQTEANSFFRFPEKRSIKREINFRSIGKETRILNSINYIIDCLDITNFIVQLFNYSPYMISRYDHFVAARARLFFQSRLNKGASFNKGRKTEYRVQ